MKLKQKLSQSNKNPLSLKISCIDQLDMQSGHFALAQGLSHLLDSSPISWHTLALQDLQNIVILREQIIKSITNLTNLSPYLIFVKVPLNDNVTSNLVKILSTQMSCYHIFQSN